jgi:signal transduction histidine kinase
LTYSLPRRDLLVVAALLTWGTFDVVTHRLGGPLPGAIVAMLLLALPLALRRVYPLAVLCAAGAGLALVLRQDSTGADADSVAICALIALYSCGAHGRGWRTWVGVAGAAVFAAVALATNGDPAIGGGDYVFFEAVAVFPWLTGYAIGRQRARTGAAALRAAQAEAERLAVIEEERRRIARELHDVVAHAISVIVVQARGGRRVLDDHPEQTAEAFGQIERTGSEALTEMRRLLSVLRSPTQTELAPQPSISELNRLAAQVSSSGLPVEVRIEGTPVDLPPGVDLSAYRIVQEALTNALKHAGPARALVVVRYTDDDLELEIRDDGAGGGSAAAVVGGLAGVRERVAVFGGEMESGPQDHGGYLLRVRLPLGTLTR